MEFQPQPSPTPFCPPLAVTVSDMDDYYIHPPSGASILHPCFHPIPITLYASPHYLISSAQIWTNLTPDHIWYPIALDLDPLPTPLHTLDPSNHFRWRLYRANVDTTALPAGSYRFCIRVKHNSNDDEDQWVYLGADGPGRDSTIILHSSHELLVSLADIFETSHPPSATFLEASSSSFSSSSSAWTVSFPLPAGPKGSLSTYPLGTIRISHHTVSLARPNAWWLAPQLGVPTDRDTQFILTLRTDGTFVLIIPVSSHLCWTALRGSEDGPVVLRCVNETGNEMKAACVISIGRNPFELIKQTVNHIITHVLGHVRQPISKIESVYDNKLGYCTWNAFMKDVTQADILSALASLRDNGIPVRYLVIDDGWQDYNQDDFLVSIEANADKFPLGLKRSIAEIRECYPELDLVGVWHTLWGYWRGISPTSRLASTYKVITIPRGRVRVPGWDGDVHLISADSVSKFYSDFYAFLEGAGVGMVKVDNQGSFDTLQLEDVNEADGGAGIVRAYQDALCMAARERFAYRMIYCMALAPKYYFEVFATEAPAMEGRGGAAEGKPIMRNSDDFFPDQSVTHPLHLQANALNSLLTHTFSRVTPDWDMFQSFHPWARFHAAARAISGGPIYITDSPGKHNTGLVHTLIAERPDGDYYILRSARPAMPTIDTIFSHLSRGDPIKIFNTQLDRWGVLGIWCGAIEGGRRVVAFAMNDVAALEIRAKDKYAMYLITSGHVQRVHERTERILVALAPMECEVAVFAPLEEAHLSEGRVIVGCFGLINKFNAPQPILAAALEDPCARMMTYRVNLQSRSDRCGFFLEIHSSERWTIKVDVDGKSIETERIKYEQERRLVIVDLMTAETSRDREWFVVRLTVKFE